MAICDVRIWPTSHLMVSVPWLLVSAVCNNAHGMRIFDDCGTILGGDEVKISLHILIFAIAFRRWVWYILSVKRWLFTSLHHGRSSCRHSSSYRRVRCEDAPACGCDRTGEAPVSRAQYIAYKNAMGVRRFVAGRVVSMAEGRALELSALADSKARGQREVHIVAAARDRIAARAHNASLSRGVGVTERLRALAAASKVEV